MHHNNEQSKFISIHLCALTLKELAYSIPDIKYRYSGQMNAEPMKTIKFTIYNHYFHQNNIKKRIKMELLLLLLIKKYNYILLLVINI